MKRRKKQINKTAKGNRVEDIARTVLEKDGWLVEKKPNVRFASKDFWGRFDFICINHKGFRLIQVKTDRAKPRDRRIIRNFPCPKNTTKELWIYKTKTGQWMREIVGTHARHKSEKPPRRAPSHS